MERNPLLKMPKATHAVRYQTMTPRSSIFAPLLAALAILLLPLGAYLGGYFWLGKYGEFNFGVLTIPQTDDMQAWRAFPRRWMISVYQPAGRVESWVRGYEVDLSSDEPDLTPTIPRSDEEMLPEEAPGEEPRDAPRGVRIIINEATGQIVL
jgi:hypothetical protein